MKRVITSLLAIATMVSCAKEESTSVEAGSVAQFSTESAVTRVATSTSTSTWKVGDLVGISSDDWDYMNVQYEVSEVDTDGKVTFACVNEDEQIILPRNEEVKYVAYYPYQNIINDDYFYVSDVSNQNDLGAIDFIVAEDSVAGMEDATDVKFTFEHALAMVQFNFSLGEDMVAAYKDFSTYTPSIVISGAYTTYVYSHLGYSYANNYATKYNATGNISVSVAASDTKPTATAIVNPIGAEHRVTLICTFNTHVYEYTLTTFNPTRNTISNYDITLGFDEISVNNNPSITEWKYYSDTATDLGTSTETTTN